MTVYTPDLGPNPFGGFGGGMRNPTPYGGGIAGGIMNRPPPFMPQQPMPQMPRRMPGGPNKGGTTSIPMRRPPMQRPGGPGKARTGPRGGLMRRGRGSLMRGGPGKGRGQPQMPMPQPSGGFFLGNMLNNAMSQGQIGQPQQSFMGRVANNIPQPPMMRTHALPALPLNRGFYGGGITDLY